MKSQFVKELTRGKLVDSEFQIIDCEVRDAKNGRYLALQLRDRTGQIVARRWSATGSEIDSASTIRYARVRGDVQEYQGKLQVIINQPLTLLAAPNDPTDYEIAAPIPYAELKQRLADHIAGVSDPWLNTVLHGIFDDPDFRAKFDIAPAAQKLHHAFRHGLLQHTLEVADLVAAIAQVQQRWGWVPVCRDLMVAGALMHDIGKIDELEYSGNPYGITTPGALLGHITMGYQRITAYIDSVEDFPQSLRSALLHIILSHHGKLEHGSPVGPMFREAKIVSVADDLDARLYYMQELAEGAADGELFKRHWALDERVYLGDLGISAEPIDTRDEDRFRSYETASPAMSSNETMRDSEREATPAAVRVNEGRSILEATIPVDETADMLSGAGTTVVKPNFPAQLPLLDLDPGQPIVRTQQRQPRKPAGTSNGHQPTATPQPAPKFDPLVDDPFADE